MTINADFNSARLLVMLLLGLGIGASLILFDWRASLA